MTEHTHHVFLSYSRRDATTMTKVRDKLISAGISVWTDERLSAGTSSWKNSIETAVREAGCIVVLLSPDAKQSEWVERELDYARLLKRSVFPVLVRGDQVDSIPFELVNAQYIDLRHDINIGLENLIIAIRQHLSLHSPFTEPVSVVTSVVQPTIPELIDTPRIPLNTYIENTGRLLGWYFLRPDLLIGYSKLGQQKSVIRLNAWTITTLVWIVLVLPQIISLISGREAPFDLLNNPNRNNYTDTYSPNFWAVAISIGLFLIAWNIMGRLSSRGVNVVVLLGLFIKSLIILIITTFAFVGAALLLIQSLGGLT